jgi:hypothetical protein
MLTIIKNDLETEAMHKPLFVKLCSYRTRKGF